MTKLIIVLSLFLFSNIVLSKQERSSMCEPRVPSVNLSKAIELVIINHEKYGNKGQEFFIDEAKLKCSNNSLSWFIGYRTRAYETGQMQVSVGMNGVVKISGVLKDG